MKRELLPVSTAKQASTHLSMLLVTTSAHRVQAESIPMLTNLAFAPTALLGPTVSPRPQVALAATPAPSRTSPLRMPAKIARWDPIRHLRARLRA